MKTHFRTQEDKKSTSLRQMNFLLRPRLDLIGMDFPKQNEIYDPQTIGFPAHHPASEGSCFLNDGGWSQVPTKALTDLMCPLVGAEALEKYEWQEKQMAKKTHVNHSWILSYVDVFAWWFVSIIYPFPCHHIWATKGYQVKRTWGWLPKFCYSKSWLAKNGQGWLTTSFSTLMWQTLCRTNLPRSDLNHWPVDIPSHKLLWSWNHICHPSWPAGTRGHRTAWHAVRRCALKCWSWWTVSDDRYQITKNMSD